MIAESVADALTVEGLYRPQEDGFHLYFCQQATLKSLADTKTVFMATLSTLLTVIWVAKTTIFSPPDRHQRNVKS